jgi:hypothetical protein
MSFPISEGHVLEIWNVQCERYSNFVNISDGVVSQVSGDVPMSRDFCCPTLDADWIKDSTFALANDCHSGSVRATEPVQTSNGKFDYNAVRLYILL